MEEELENERKLRQKSEMQRKDLEAQLDELQDQLETAGGATNAQVNQSAYHILFNTCSYCSDLKF